MQTMATYYVYDMSEYCGDEAGWAFPEAGLYECFDLRPYFEDPGTHPYFIRVAGELAGFAIVDDQRQQPRDRVQHGAVLGPPEVQGPRGRLRRSQLSSSAATPACGRST